MRRHVLILHFIGMTDSSLTSSVSYYLGFFFFTFLKWLIFFSIEAAHNIAVNEFPEAYHCKGSLLRHSSQHSHSNSVQHSLITKEKQNHNNTPPHIVTWWHQQRCNVLLAKFGNKSVITRFFFFLLSLRIDFVIPFNCRCKVIQPWWSSNKTWNGIIYEAQ